MRRIRFLISVLAALAAIPVAMSCRTAGERISAPLAPGDADLAQLRWLTRTPRFLDLPRAAAGRDGVPDCVPGADGSAAMVTDKADYAPGEIAILAGCGFWPAESVDVSISIDDPAAGDHIGDFDWTVSTADTEGSFVTHYQVPPEAAWMTLTATAMGYDSGLIATVTFTDSVASVSITAPTTGSPITLTSLPATFNVSFNYSTSSGGTANGQVKLRSGGTDVVVPGQVTIAAGTGLSTTLPLTIPAGTANGSYDVQAIVNKPPAGGGDPAARNDTETAAVLINVPTCTATNSPPAINASNRDLGALCTGDGTYTTTVTPADFGPSASDPNGDTVTVTFDDGSTSKQITLGGLGASVSLTLNATDNGSARSQSGCPPLTDLSSTTTVQVLSDVMTQPTNAAPKFSATDKSYGDIIPVVPPGTVLVTVNVGDFLPQTADDDGDTVTVTFDDGSTSKQVTFSEGHQSETLTLKATDNGSARDAGSPCEPLADASTTIDVTASASVHNCPMNSAPIVMGGAYEAGTFNVTTGCELTVPVTPANFGPTYLDPEGDPQDGDFFLSAPAVTLSEANNWSATVGLSAMDDPSARNDVLCFALNPMIGSTLVEVRANVVVLTNSAPVVSGSDYSAGDYCVTGDETVTIPVTPAHFDSSAADPDGDPFELSLSPASVDFTLPTDQSDATFEAFVTVSATDDPGARNATLAADCSPLAAMTGTKMVKVTATLHRNRPPTISATDADLGDLFGCLVGGSFQKTVAITTGMFNPVLADPDGDPVSVTANVTSVTLVGPGMASAEVILTVTDDPSGRADCLAALSAGQTVLATARLVYNSDLFTVGPPLSLSTTRKVKRGSTVPVKFRNYDCSGTEICTNIGPANAGRHRVALYYNASTVPSTEVTWEDAGSSSPSGDDFRYSGTCGVDGQWIFNLNTGTMLLNCTYKIVINLDDGTRQCIYISIVR